MNSSDEIKTEIRKLQDQLKKIEHKEKAVKGVLKRGEFCMLTIQDYDEDRGKLVGEPYNPIIFFGSYEDFPVLMTEAYIEWGSFYFKDLTDQAPLWEKWKVKKISKEEAFKYL